MGTPALVTNQMIYEQLVSVKKELAEIKNKIVLESIEEISLNKAQRYLKLGTDSILQLVTSGKLKARVYRDNNRRKRYRFRIADIRTFQETNKYDHVSLHTQGMETTEVMLKRITLEVKTKSKRGS